MRRQLLNTACLCAATLCLVRCEEPAATKAPLPAAQLLVITLPANITRELPSPERNPLTVEGVELGRMLFYDPVLSADNRVSCATCHQQERAFSDGEALTTVGVSGKPQRRHVPALMNLAWQKGLFWDGGAKDMESQVFGPLTHPDEMGQDLKELVQELQSRQRYREQFRLAYGRGRITGRRQDIGKYKTPTLRNIALTAPYMHDGRFRTLDEVLEHYRHGVVRSASLAPELQQGGMLGIPLTPQETEQIILFLHTLTDEAFIHNPAFSNPR